MRKTGQGHLLVVDDNEMNRDMLSRRLQQRATRSGLPKTVSGARSDQGEQIRPDCAWVMMPGLNGFEMLPMIRQSYSIVDLPVILATAKDRSDDIVEGMQLGANDYVTKPIDFPVLMARLQVHLQLKKLAQLKDEFLRIASHDLKNPLSTILMSSHIVLDRVPPGTAMPKEIYQMLTFIVNAARISIGSSPIFLISRRWKTASSNWNWLRLA